MSKIYIFENSNYFHVEEALVSTYKVLKALNFEIVMALGSIPLATISNNNFLMSKNIIPANGILNLLRFILSVKKDDIVVFPTITARNIIFIYFTSFIFSKNIYSLQSANSWIHLSDHPAAFHNRLIRRLLHFLKQRLLKSAFQIFVANTNIKCFLQKHILTPINIVPFKFYETDAVILPFTTPVNFVIPGAVDLSKKNIHHIREATKKLNHADLEKIRIILLGGPTSPADKQFCKDWKTEIGDSLITYDNFIPTEEFEYQLKNAHFIIGALKVDYEDKYNKEIYGTTKDTGVDAQAIAYAAPLIINEPFKILPETESSSLTYDSSTKLANYLKKIPNDQKLFLDLQNQAMKNSQKFTLINIKTKINNLSGATDC